MISNRLLDVAEGAVLGILPTVLGVRPRGQAKLAFDVAAGIAGCVAVAWFVAPLSVEIRGANFAAPGLLSAFGSVLAIALETLFG